MSSPQDKESPFIGKKIKLRSVEKTDLPDIMKHWNTYEMRIGLGGYIPESASQREEWINKITDEAKKGESYNFAIINKENDEFLGIIALKRVNNISRNASMGVAIYNPENQG